MGRLDGRVILITGSTGIAAATASLATAEGARVFLAGLPPADGSAAPAGFCAGDLTVTAHAEAAVAQCVERFGRVDGLFNVAGVSGRRLGDGPLDQCSDEGWDAVIETNLRSVFLVSRAVLRHMLARPIGASSRGVILNMASVLALAPDARHFATHAYSASKGAIVSLSRAMAAFYAPHRIRVNCIAPGLVRTPMSARAQSDPAVLEYMRSKQPLCQDLIEPEDVARASVFLLSDEARMITGQVLGVDAGWCVSEA